MATFKRLFRFRPAAGGNGTVRTLFYPEAASQTFKKGDPVYLVSGKVTVAVAYTSGDPVVAGTKILGHAAMDATGTTDSSIPVIIADEHVEFLLPIYHPTPASAITAITQVGVAYELYRATISGNLGFGVDISETTDTKVVVQEIDATYPVGEQYGHVWVKYIPAQQDLNL
jgi:hypothetical protein